MGGQWCCGMRMALPYTDLPTNRHQFHNTFTVYWRIPVRVYRYKYCLPLLRAQRCEMRTATKAIFKYLDRHQDESWEDGEPWRIFTTSLFVSMVKAKMHWKLIVLRSLRLEDTMGAHITTGYIHTTDTLYAVLCRDGSIHPLEFGMSYCCGKQYQMWSDAVLLRTKVFPVVPIHQEVHAEIIL